MLVQLLLKPSIFPYNSSSKKNLKLHMDNTKVNKYDNQIKDDDEELERSHFQKVIGTFRFYRLHSLRRVVLAEKYFKELPEHQQKLVPNFIDHLQAVRVCVDHNYEIIKLIIADTDGIFENKQYNCTMNDVVHPTTEFDMDKLKSTLKQVMRDWSTDGQLERDACYKPVIDELHRLFPADSSVNQNQVSVLVPGAGLGRLAYEIAKHGFISQGNEISLFMLFTSNFILNKCKDANEFTIYPWVHQYCNNLSKCDQVRPVQFPDINPSDLPSDSNFSMVAGDFLDVYTVPECWDCVATVFFIDTAHNIIAYIEAIAKILKPGGYWINYGPLLYHFADMPNESSVELSYDEVKHVILNLDFEFVKEEIGLSARYTQNQRSMLRYEYDCVFFVVRKKDSTN